MKTMPFASQKTDAITFPTEETFASLEEVSQDASAASIVFWSLAQCGGSNSHPE